MGTRTIVLNKGLAAAVELHILGPEARGEAKTKTDVGFFGVSLLTTLSRGLQ